MQQDVKKSYQCPLCEGQDSRLYLDDGCRVYHQCQQCRLVFVLPSYILSAQQEKQIYDLHDNNELDIGYRQFLNRLCEPLTQRLAPAAAGLDFGCGPGPLLVKMLQEKGHSMSRYDIFYAPDRQVLDKQYDFLTCTEVVEHLSRPGEVIQQLLSMLIPGGWLGIMTKLVRDADAFSRWHYKNDLTHICFFSKATFNWLADKYKLECYYVAADVILLRHSESVTGAPEW